MNVGHALAALRGAVGFLSRLPVGRDERAWEAFRGAPWTLPVAGYALGSLLALVVGPALVAGLPGPTVALAYVLAVVALTGINHADGVADLGDAAVVHGGPERRREVLGDTVTGVGGTLGLVLVVAGLALGALGLPGLPLAVAVGLVVACEVGAKLAMAALVTLGAPAHEGFGAAVAGDLSPRALPVPLVLGLPAVALPGVAVGGRPGAVTGGALPAGVVPAGVAVGTAALGSALLAGLALLWWARRRLGGVSGDVFGAGNELARVVALHAGLVAWDLAPHASLVVQDLAPRAGLAAQDLAPLGSALAAVEWLPEVVAWTPW